MCFYCTCPLDLHVIAFISSPLGLSAEFRSRHKNKVAAAGSKATITLMCWISWGRDWRHFQPRFLSILVQRHCGVARHRGESSFSTHRLCGSRLHLASVLWSRSSSLLLCLSEGGETGWGAHRRTCLPPGQIIITVVWVRGLAVRRERACAAPGREKNQIQGRKWKKKQPNPHTSCSSVGFCLSAAFVLIQSEVRHPSSAPVSSSSLTASQLQ